MINLKRTKKNKASSQISLKISGKPKPKRKMVIQAKR